MADSSGDLQAWNSVADSYASQVGVEGDLIYRRFEPFIWRHLGDDLDGMSVLDLGCGHGWLSALIHQAGANVVGVDGSSELLAKARSTYPGIEFEQADLVEGLPSEVEQQGFDRVIANMVVMDLPSLDALGRSIQRSLKPRGRVILTWRSSCSHQ